MAGRTMRVLLLEPDVWRFQGIARYLTDSELAEVVGEPRPERSLDVATRGLDTPPDVIMVADRLIDLYGREIIDRLRTAHRAPILAFGESRCVETTAALLVLGAAGYFVTSSAQYQLIEALKVVSSGRIWAPREAVLVAARPPAPPPPTHGAGSEDRILLALLREGLSNKEIASRIGVAEVTVKARLSRMYRRYGVASRLQLLAALPAERDSA